VSIDSSDESDAKAVDSGFEEQQNYGNQNEYFPNFMKLFIFSGRRLWERSVEVLHTYVES
jgi:hypothetical protein